MTETCRDTGLTAAEAARRLAADGPNSLTESGRRGPLAILREVLSEPMLLMLLAAGAIYLALGDRAEAALIVGLAGASIGITIVQELRSERTLEALRDLTSPRALVVRDGERRRIPGRDVVVGDLVVLGEGDRVPADARLLEADALEVDESLLTGESVAVPKRVASADAPADDAAIRVHAATLVVRGRGLALVTATGAASEIGRIGTSLAGIETEDSGLRRETRRLVRLFAGLGGVVTVAVVVLYGLTRGAWLEAFLAGIALGMAMLPEEFPVVLTVFLVMGAWRISRAGVLTRRAAAIETLGAATVLCTDKTGTLTENRMSVVEVRRDGTVFRHGAETPAGTATRTLDIGRLASEPEPFDPMERAFHAAADPGGSGEGATLVHRYPLSADLLAMTNVWLTPDGSALVAAKGAPEAIAALCRLEAEALAEMRAAVEAMATRGLRVIGVAEAAHPGGPHPDRQDGFAFAFLGLVGLADPIRPAVPEAIRQARRAGIRIVMITGDHPATARAIAEAAGIDGGRVVTGDEIAALPEAELAEVVREASVFARVRPEQKLAIVRALAAAGEVVAMTGDGVNDAPSLKAAHIGIAMGRRGTDVAREASSLVLVDDDFGAVVETIRLGRRIYDNIRKAMAFVMAAHVPIAGLALLPLLFGLPLVLLPVHIAFLEMIVDPVSSIAFEAEPEEPGLMERPPRAPDAPLFSVGLIAWALAQGLAVFALAAGAFLTAMAYGTGAEEARSVAFLGIVLGSVVLILLARTRRGSVVAALATRNRTLLAVLAADAAILTVILAVPPVRALFGFGALDLAEVGLVAVAAAAVFVALEWAKRIWVAPETAGSARAGQ